MGKKKWNITAIIHCVLLIDYVWSIPIPTSKPVLLFAFVLDDAGLIPFRMAWHCLRLLWVHYNPSSSCQSRAVLNSEIFHRGEEGNLQLQGYGGIVEFRVGGGNFHFWTVTEYKILSLPREAHLVLRRGSPTPGIHHWSGIKRKKLITAFGKQIESN